MEELRVPLGALDEPQRIHLINRRTVAWLLEVALIEITFVPVIGALNLVNFSYGDTFELGLLDYTLTIVRVDRLSFLFGLLFHLAAFLGVIFSVSVPPAQPRSVHGHCWQSPVREAPNLRKPFRNLKHG